MSVLEVHNITKRFPGTLALDNVSASFESGKVHALVGKNGSGKSTFLRCLNLLEKPSSGQIIFEGIDIAAENVDIDTHRKKIGMIFQHFNVFPHLTVLENITITPILELKTPKAQAEKEAIELLKKVGLEDKKDEYPRKLSGGQKQRISIARVFLKNPKILILDEATSALDNESEYLVSKSLERLAKGRTTLTIAHRLTTIQNADRILVLNENGIVEEGNHKELLEKKGVYYQLYMMANEIA